SSPGSPSSAPWNCSESLLSFPSPCAPAPPRSGLRGRAAAAQGHSHFDVPPQAKELAMKTYRPCVCPVQEKFLATRQALAAALIERDEEIDLVLTALVCQEHVLLVSPPGCAKSLLLDAVLGWLNGRRFSVLLTKFTVPEEIAGPISVTALKADRYRRV